MEVVVDHAGAGGDSLTVDRGEVGRDRHHVDDGLGASPGTAVLPM